MKFDFDDILLVPAETSSVNSRTEVNPKNEDGYFPLFTAPMDTVVGLSNMSVFLKNKINIALPRHLETDVSPVFISYGIEDFKMALLSGKELAADHNALIDVANGHMDNLLKLSKEAKQRHGDRLKLMVGNVANPRTILAYEDNNIDFIRLGIGNGSACTTSANTGIGYPMASLINETYDYKVSNGLKIKIVADGGFKNFSDIIKALALGADYVMLGGILNKCVESSSQLFVQRDLSMVLLDDLHAFETEEAKNDFIKELLKDGILYKLYRGMSTKEVQKTWGRTELKTAEGISKFQKVEYTLSGWCENFEDYLRSAMSYTNSKTLPEFKNTKFELITNNATKRFYK